LPPEILSAEDEMSRCAAQLVKIKSALLEAERLYAEAVEVRDRYAALRNSLLQERESIVAARSAGDTNDAEQGARLALITADLETLEQLLQEARVRVTSTTLPPTASRLSTTRLPFSTRRMPWPLPSWL
jgi:hypothetical protein